MLSGGGCSTTPTAGPSQRVEAVPPRYLLVECEYERVDWEDERGLEKAYGRNLLIGKGCNDQIRKMREWVDGVFPVSSNNEN
ncbi:hypothetical protein D3C78_1321310 [compost metagenome]